MCVCVSIKHSKAFPTFTFWTAVWDVQVPSTLILMEEHPLNDSAGNSHHFSYLAVLMYIREWGNKEAGSDVVLAEDYFFR